MAESTTYKHDLKVSSDQDFEVGGMVRFTIEPRCTFEGIPFMISSKDGKLSVRFLDGC